jgi:hypothetical protein
MKLPLAAAAMALVIVASGCTQTEKINAFDRLKPCVGEEGPSDAYCGTYTVFENRDTKQAARSTCGSS